ncbi:helix-turn-helix domain-containing protein [Paenibacillus sp. 1182]
MERYFCFQSERCCRFVFNHFLAMRMQRRARDYLYIEPI